MSRTTILVLVALGAALAGFAFSTAADQFQDESSDSTTSFAARPQSAVLDWKERYGKPGQRLIFSVDRIEVLTAGWRVHLSVENDTPVAYGVGDPRATLDRAFGLMLFATNDIRELEERNSSGTLPEPRAATRYKPSLPPILEPHASWEGTISARGALVAGSWVRVVFGALIAVGKPPEELDERIVWITDHAYRLR